MSAKAPRRIREPHADPERAAAEAARRASSKLRRFCAANALNRLGTLTYAGEGCHDQRAFRDHIASFWRHLRAALGPLPYVWVGEWHKSGHGLHAHFALGEFVPIELIDRAWGRGFVHIKLLGKLDGETPRESARRAAGYLAKYVAKAFDERRLPGLHRYDVAQGYQPEVVRVWGESRWHAIGAASALVGGEKPSSMWVSDDQENWAGPPSVWLSWS